MRASLLRRGLQRIRREAWVIVITLLALVTRLFYNLALHPPRRFIFSDMGGYFNRAEDWVRQPFSATADNLSFFPWGTHAFLGIVRYLFTTPATCPRDSPNSIAAAGCWPMDAAMAVLGAFGVCYTMLVARRLTRGGPDGGKRRWLYVLVGLGLVFYYPLIAQGSFFMSEIPFFACVSAVTFHSLRLSDEGRTSDAVLLGIFAGLGALARPQMLMSVAVLAVFWLFRRRQLPGITLRKLAIACVPIAICLAFSAVRTTRHLRAFPGHDHEYALVSTNDALNYAFGRCHPIAIEAHMKGYSSFFGPPSLGALHFSAKDRKKKNLFVALELKPAFPDDPTCDINKRHAEKKEDSEPCINTQGKMWSRDVMNKLASDCVKKTGMGKQLYYAMTHVALNYGFNLTWPDSGQPLKEKWVDLSLSHFGQVYDAAKPRTIKVSSGRPIIEAWQMGFGIAIVPLASLACLLAFRRRRARYGLLAMHIFAMNLVAILYFGDTRLRTPYDGLLVILFFDLLSRIVRWTGKKTARFLAS